MLLETLWAYEEFKIEKHIDTDAEFIARAEEIRRPFPASSVDTSTFTPETGNPASNQQLAVAQECLCVVCMSTARSVVMIPCGHLAVCQSCCECLQQCPICRFFIRGSIQVYIV